MVAFVWTQFPFAAILLMAALTMIDSELYDAARVDGAGIAQRFRYVTFPNIRPIVVVLLIYHALVALTSYDLVYAMTGGRARDRDDAALLPDLAGELLDDELRHRLGDRLPPGAAVARASWWRSCKALPTRLLPGR